MIYSQLKFFVNYVFPPLILGIGLFGNTMGFVTLLKKDLINIGPRDTYLYIFASDSFYLLQIIGTNLQSTYGLDVTLVSNLTCKLWNYFNYWLAPVSPWLIVYITFDRYISIDYPAKRFFLRKPTTQLAWFLFVIVVNLIYFSPIIYYDIILSKSIDQTNTTNLTEIICDFSDPNALIIVSHMDLGLRVVCPFFLMTLFSILLSRSLFASRTRIVENFLAEENATF